MMQVSTKTEYGLRCLLLLARQGEKSSSISQIAAQEGVPKHYAQQILLTLRRAGIVKSIRGTEGGFALAQADVSVGAIVRALEGVPFDDTCGRFNRKKNCGHMGDCSIRPVWQTVSRRLWETLDRITLKSLIADENVVGRTLERELPVLEIRRG